MTFYRKHKYLIDRYVLFVLIIAVSLCLAIVFHPLSWIK